MPQKPAVFSGPPRTARTHSDHVRPSRLPQVARWRESDRFKRLRRLWWQDERNQYCTSCGIDLLTLPQCDRVIDHVTDHKGEYGLFWDVQGNWQSLCRFCHSRKTITENRPGKGVTK